MRGEREKLFHDPKLSGKSHMICASVNERLPMLGTGEAASLDSSAILRAWPRHNAVRVSCFYTASISQEPTIDLETAEVGFQVSIV